MIQHINYVTRTKFLLEDSKALLKSHKNINLTLIGYINFFFFKNCLTLVSLFSINLQAFISVVVDLNI